MKLKPVLLLAATLSLGACAGLIQTASISEAYKHYERQQYDRTLQLISQAENSKETPAEMKAELTYLKAQTYERLGQGDTATTLYEYLSEKHSDSQYGHLAADRLSSNL